MYTLICVSHVIITIHSKMALSSELSDVHCPRSLMVFFSYFKVKPYIYVDVRLVHVQLPDLFMNHLIH